MADRRRDDYLLTDDPAWLDVERVHRWLSEQSYWAAGRSLDVVRRSFAGSVPYSVLDDSGQVAVARVITDRATFAWLCDVFVDPVHRGRGLGRWLVDSVVEDLSELGVRRIVLRTQDAHDVYRRIGFGGLDELDSWMQLDRQP